MATPAILTPAIAPVENDLAELVGTGPITEADAL